MCPLFICEMDVTPLITTLKLLWRAIRFAVRIVRYAITLLIFVMLIQRSTVPIGRDHNAIAIITRDYHFNFVAWELDALRTKVGQFFWGVHPFMNEADRAQFVRDYMADVARVQQLEAQITRIFVDPDVADPQVESATLRAERDALRDDLNNRQPLAESILEGQVAAVLVDLGFGFHGQLLPPMAAHFSQTPNALVVSPRDKINIEVLINLEGMTIDQITALEEQVDRERDVSSLIVGIGGIAIYPAMILETSSIPFAVDTIAHEWLHHYLFAYPLGYQFTFDGDTRTINETTANIFGQEVGRLVLERYYPDLVPPQPSSEPLDDAPSSPPASPDPDAFDFGLAMHETRTTVDEMLADGRVEEAETYMEERRRLFVENGFQIRKLNQAYFAFFGGYQSGKPGAGGADPTGAAIRGILDASPSLQAWIVTMRSITTREELLKICERMCKNQDIHANLIEKQL